MHMVISAHELAELLIQVGELYPAGETIPDSYIGAALDWV